MRSLWRVLGVFLILLVALIIVMISLRREPSGATWLAYSSNRAGSWDIYRQIDTQVEQLTESPSDELAPFWSPDGQSILYVSFSGSKSDIHRLDLENRTETVITAAFDISASFASMSPDGGWILLTGFSSSNADIFKIPANLAELTPLISTIQDETAASLSPDGRSIAYYARVEADNSIGLFQWSLVDNTSEQIPLDDLTFSDPYPASWSPDGEWITFGATRFGTSDIYRLHLKTGEVERLTTSRSDDLMPVWSPDGRWIAYVSNADGNPNIYRMRPDGSAKEQLTTDPSFELYPAWSPLIDTAWQPNFLLGVVWVVGVLFILLSLAIRQRSSTR